MLCSEVETTDVALQAQQILALRLHSESLEIPVQQLGRPTCCIFEHFYALSTLVLLFVEINFK